MSGYLIINGDAARIPLADSSVALIIADPPYFKVKSEAWDYQWKTPADYLDWIGRLCIGWRRVLKPNGSLYCFASPRMAARVECKIAETFEVLSRITWRKPPFGTKAEMFRKEDLRTFFPASEAIVFAEQPGADSMAMGESGYAAQCERLHGFVFEPLRAYLDGERRRAAINKADCNAACGFSRSAGGMASRKYFGQSQWCLPTAEHYEALRQFFNATGGDYLRREYEDLRREYEDLRRPFSVSADVPYTDVWDFPTVPTRPGKHVCEKPLAMIEHMVRVSSREGDVVLDCFMGSGIGGMACKHTGRRFVGIEIDPHDCRMARRYIERPHAPIRRSVGVERHPLFSAIEP